MPNQPAPYEMRDWKQVTFGYDSLVFDFDATGTYLPLIWENSNGINYPNHDQFGLHTVVGATYPTNAEAVNILPAVISASLVGIDKSNQNGKNWVLMCEEFFNKRPEENIYLNNPATSSGQDWWYETMPNVFFYQLYSMYPHIGDFDYQFTTIADRMLEAVQALGGRATPWHIPYMNYRAWSFSTMKPLTTDVPEPEAAGAIAWLLYNAFVTTGDEKYRIGAEWSMEFLNSRTSNPSYELQLSYGVYMAARMNAELGANYDIEKMLNWCFNIGALRQWGAVLGRWGNYDCYGLIGESIDNDYVFYMNTVEQVGALVPLTRYDDRFARAIGKWTLNAANACRLFYPNYLPDFQQDSESWAHQYDPNSYIAHEAMRERANSFSPYATGDAISGGWGQTNLALYGSSHVGILGGIIDTTTILMILQLDVLKTDYYHADAYPTYLYFNPYDETKMVQINVGVDQRDLYDAVSNTFVANGVSGVTMFSIPANEAILLVVAPAGGNVTYDLDNMLIDGVVADYRSGQPVTNYPPRIKSFAVKSETVIAGDSTLLYCTASDKDNDDLTYIISTLDVFASSKQSPISWLAPDSVGTYRITCIVDDGNGGQDSASVTLEIVRFINHLPHISALVATPYRLNIGGTSEIICTATDSDNEQLSYLWSADAGELTPSDSIATWTAPHTAGYYYIRCDVQDEHGGQASDSVGIVVQDSSATSTGVPVAFYPFNGNANDESGNNNHSIVSGATLVADRFGVPNSAYSFNGTTDKIQIPYSELLNFRDAITVSFWMNIAEFFDREAYPISHGNWENRWKISITNHGIRWTVKSSDGIKDLDSQFQLETGVYYNITTLYDGLNYDIYINGVLDNHITFSGLIMQTNIELVFGQALPNDPNYNFKGVLDDIRIYNYALSEDEIKNIYDEKHIPVENTPEGRLPDHFRLHQNFPNPFNQSTTINYQLKAPGFVRIAIFNMLGENVKNLVVSKQLAGFYSVSWNGDDDNGGYRASGVYICQMIVDGQVLARCKLVLLK